MRDNKEKPIKTMKQGEMNKNEERRGKKEMEGKTERK